MMGYKRTYKPSDRRLLRDRRGASVLEMTVMLPFLVALAFGVIEFGRALQHYHTINKSVRDAARFLARVDITCADPPATTCNIVDSNDLNRAKTLALTGYVSGGTPILSYWTDPDTVSVTITPFDNSGGAYRGKPNMPVIRVTASVPFQDLGMLAVFGISPITFNTRHDELHIGE